VTNVVDLWRAIDPDARLVSGSARAMGRPVRSVARTRAVAPHLPQADDAALLLVDAAVLAVPAVDALLNSLRDAQLAPVAIILAGSRLTPEAADAPIPVLVSEQSPAVLAEAAAAYLVDEPAALERISGALRLACAEASLSDPQLATPAGLVAARIGRGVAISVDGELQALQAWYIALGYALVNRRQVSPPHIRDTEGRSRLLTCVREAVDGRDKATVHAALVLLSSSQHLDNLWHLEAHLGARANAARTAQPRGA